MNAQGKLNQHLPEIEVQISELLESIISDLAQKNGIDDNLKATTQFYWIQEMDALKAGAKGDCFAYSSVSIKLKNSTSAQVALKWNFSVSRSIILMINL